MIARRYKLTTLEDEKDLYSSSFPQASQSSFDIPNSLSGSHLFIFLNKASVTIDRKPSRC